MPFKKLTGHGVLFIATVCKGTGNSLLKGKMPYKLKNSNVPESTIFDAKPKNDQGVLITTNEDLGLALIGWFNDYAEEYQLDANIIAAQAFAESGYRLFAHSSTGAMAISQFLASSLYDAVIGNRGAAKTVIPNFTQTEKNTLTLNLQNPFQETSYLYYKNPTFVEIAVANKGLLLQNMMDNPDLVIKAQCRLMSGLGKRSNDIASSALFGYNLGASYVRGTYTETIQVAKKKGARFGDAQSYVLKIFKFLGLKHTINGTEVSFGYDLKFGDGSFNTFDANLRSSSIVIDNVDRSIELSPNFTLGDLMITSTGIKNIPNDFEIGNLRSLAVNVLEKVRKLIGKPLIINSGFRSSGVNSEVKGVIDSQHRIGEAADIRFESEDPNELKLLFDAIIASNIVYDQIIFETKSETNVLRRWIHISYTSSGTNRKQRKLANLVGKQMIYTTLA